MRFSLPGLRVLMPGRAVSLHAVARYAKTSTALSIHIAAYALSANTLADVTEQAGTWR
jgi:hypothetical protein